MKLGYNTNGLAHHRLLEAIDLLADEGYQCVAITLDAGALDPYEEPGDLAKQVVKVRRALDHRDMARVVETGARYLLNPRRKHDPTLLDPDPKRRAIRQDFLLRSIDVARDLEAPAVSLWSGRLPDQVDEDVAMDRLAEALKPVLDRAEETGVSLAFEPEPGMFIDTLERFERLDSRVRHPLFQLTIDVGHVHCSREGDIATLLRKWGPRVLNIHIEDMVADVHEHLMFGEGTMDFPPILEALHQLGYQEGVNVELSRHSHMGVEAVRAAAAFLTPLINAAELPGGVSPTQSADDLIG
jgi:L-ribulose-5-phosphate 3-epimerase